MAPRKPSAVADAVKSTEPVAPSADNGAAEPERTIITDFTLKLQHHKDVPTIPTFLESIEEWATSKGYVILKKSTSTPGYYSWTIHTPDTLAAAEQKANNVMKEVRSLRDDPAVKAQAEKLGISVDELLKRALAGVRQAATA